MPRAGARAGARATRAGQRAARIEVQKHKATTAKARDGVKKDAPVSQSVTEVRNFTFSLQRFLLDPPPCRVASFEVNSEPHTGARPSVRLCVGLIKPVFDTFWLKAINVESATVVYHT